MSRRPCSAGLRPRRRRSCSWWRPVRNQTLAQCQPLFDAIGQRTFVVGDKPSAANLVKLSGNFLLAAMIECLGEAFALTRKGGIDPHALP